ncbi:MULTISPECIES: hypothetical protein [Microbacterium]|uniref:hypothetical protein n=1 Tax=Microbacterium TaxID=33882 RepID=UPI00344C7FCA
MADELDLDIERAIPPVFRPAEAENVRFHTVGDASRRDALTPVFDPRLHERRTDNHVITPSTTQARGA